MPLDLLFLTPSGETLPSVRFRVLPFVRLAAARNLGADWRRAPKALHKRLSFLLTLPRARVAVIQQKLFAPWELALIRKRCDTLVYDVDDALWALHPQDAGKPGSQAKAAKIAARFAHTCKAVDLVIAGNAYLEAHARDAGASTFVLPTLLDTNAYTPPPPDACGVGPLRVGWMGTHGNLFFLPEVLRQLAPHRQRIELRVVSDAPYEGELSEMVRFERWSAMLEADQLRGFEVGLMPLTDDEYTRGKCGFKILQYMAVGAAPVASAVGFNTEILTHGEDGLLVRKPEDWAEHILRLANDRELLERMAAKARATVVARFSLAAMGPRFFEAVGL
jgi:glycosyltransferase involved in cell wall biosynthesis